jgi:DHA1 family multidrug resistance protein-like MFS transporter
MPQTRVQIPLGTPLFMPWRRNLLAVWPSLFAVSLGLQAMIPGLPLYIEERFALHDPAAVRLWSGIVYGAGPLAAAVVGPFWGALGDRYGRRMMAIRSVLAIAVVMAFMPLCTSPLMLAILRTIQGVFAGYVAPAMSLVMAGVPHERQGKVLARLQTALALGLLLGPALGFEIAHQWSRAAVFWVTSALSGVALLPLALLAREDPTTLTGKGGAEPLLLTLSRDIWGVARNVRFLSLLLLLFVMRLSLNMVEPFLALWVRELGPLPWIRAHTDGLEHAVDRTTSVCFTVLAVAQLVMAPVWGRLADRVGPLRCLAWNALALAVVHFLCARLLGIEQFLGLRVLGSLFLAGNLTLAYASAGKRVPAGQRSLAFALVQTFIQFGLSLGPLWGGILSGPLGLRHLFDVAAALLLGTALLMFWFRSATAGRSAATGRAP